MNEETRAPVLDISWGSIVKIAVSLFLAYLVFLLRDILVWVLFGVIISVLFGPVIDFMQRRRVPRVISTVIVYSALIAVLAYLVYATAPLFIGEVQRFSQLLPQYFEERISPFLQGLGFDTYADFQSFIEAISRDALQGDGDVTTSGLVRGIELLSGVFGGIFSMFFVISVAMFLSVEDRPIDRTISLLFPKKYEALALSLWARSQKKVSGWFFSRVIASLFVGATTYVALILFNVPYPFSLALLSGVLNFIPVIGPLLTGVLVALLIALDSPLKALFIILAITLIQQVENNILTPVLSKKFVGLSPTLVLISLAVGAQFWGVMGAILAIPLAGILFEFLRDFLKKRKEAETVVL